MFHRHAKNVKKIQDTHKASTFQPNSRSVRVFTCMLLLQEKVFPSLVRICGIFQCRSAGFSKENLLSFHPSTEGREQGKPFKAGF